MKHKDLPERWKARLAEYLAPKQRSVLHAGDFPYKGISLTFEDGSSASFKYAFAIEIPEWGEVAVFSEHCGYHLFFLTEGLRITYNG